VRQRLLAVVLVAVVAAVAAVLVLRAGGDEEPRTLADGLEQGKRLAPGRGVTEATFDPLAYDPDEREAFEARAAAGLSHVLYARSPGGAIATAERVARWRGLVDRVAEDADLDADALEGIVFLESAGRPDAMAGGTEGAVGLTQILAETGQNLLDMRIDVDTSARLTRGIRRGRAVERRTRARLRVDERYDPRKALEATARYLRFAKDQLGRDDLALVSYHMGVGNLQSALRAYGKAEVPYAQLFFDSTPLRHARAWRVLSALGDDSSTYLWRVRAAQEIMRLHREDPEELRRLAALHARKASAEEVLHPPASTTAYGEPTAISRAITAAELVPLDAQELRARFALRLDPRIGELVPANARASYRALRPEALAVLQVIGAGVEELAGTAPLTVTSTVRDRRYQRLLLADGNAEATPGFSLHTTGFAFDVARRYRSRAQSQAFQFFLERLQALDLIAWVREPAAIHVTVGPRAAELLEG
jgi:hypothetical protein